LTVPSSPLKPPVWTWEVPTYLFVGGMAGMGAVVAVIAAATGADVTLARDARWIALIGALVSPLLLISDLGRPGRFLYMLRVFKRQSAMSVGAWTLAVFGPAVTASILFRALVTDGSPSAWLTGIIVLSDAVGLMTGLILVTYTGVLLGATAIPVWAANARVLPWLFTASSLGATASMLELIGHRVTPLHALALTAAAIDVIAGLKTKGLTRPSSMMRVAELLVGGVPLALRLLVTFWAPARTLAGVSAIAGGALSRVAWIAAGRASAAESQG
jgi:formate-dependent nitrite reductase membrane component NrfD